MLPPDTLPIAEIVLLLTIPLPTIVLDVDIGPPAVIEELLTILPPVIVFELLKLPLTKTTPIVPEAVLGSSVNVLLEAFVEMSLEEITMSPMLALAAFTVPPPLPIGPVYVGR